MHRALPRLAAAAVAAALLLGQPAGAGAAGPGLGPIDLGGVVPPPNGAAELCQSLPWACTAGAESAPVADLRRLAEKVNRRINRKPTISDRRLHGREEHWAPLTARGGDCEDFALTKMRDLIAAGVPGRQLRIATVLDRQRQPHAVLVLSHGGDDLVLDNLTNRVLSWADTGYIFLRMQDPDDKRLWRMVRGAGSLASL